MTVDIMYQEFHIMVTCDSDAAYLNIGKKNSLLSEALKREVCVCYHRYQRYLEAQKAVDLRFFKASAKAAVCGKMVVDEAQDFSRLELDLLVMAAENNQLGFFMDTNQSLQESLTIRPYLSRMLAERTRGAVTHYDLKVTYRNSQAVANLANAVLKIKNVVLHGVVDKEVEYLEMLTAKTTQGGTEWVESNDEKKLDRLKLLAARPNCVVIVPDAKMRDEAIARLETPLVFTISEIKGLEFEHVIVYHFLNQPVFDEIEEFLPEQIDAEKVYPNQPKTRENIEFNTAFAKLFTAVTRAGQSCYLVEPKNHRQQKLSHYLKSKMQTPALPAVEPVENKDPKEWADMAAILIRKGDLSDLLAARDIMQKKLGLAVPGMDKPLTASALLWVLNGKSKVDEPNELIDAVSSAPAKKTEKQRNGNKQEKSQSQLKSGSVKQVPQMSAKPIPSKSVSSKQLPPAQQRTEDEKYLDDFIKNMPANLPNFMKLDRVRGNAILHKTKLKSGMTLAEYIVNNPRQLFGDAFGAKAGWVAFANVCLEDGLFAKDFREFLFTCPGKAKILQTITIKHLRNGVQLFAGRTVPLLMCLLMASSCEPLRYIIKDRPDLIKEIHLQDLTNKHISCDLSILQNILDEINYHAIGRDFLMALLELNIGTKNGINPSVFLASMHFCTYMFDRDVWSFCDEQLVKLDKDLQVFREICRKIPSLTKKITTKDIGANSPMMVDSYRGHTLLSLLLSPTKEHYKSSFNLLDLMFDKYPEYLRDQAITRHLLAEKVDPLFATTYMHLFLHRKNSPVFYKMISYNPNLLDDLTLNRLLCEDSKGYSILYLMMWSVAGMKIFNAILDRNPAVVRGMTIEQLCSGERYKCESGEFPITFINIFSEECRVVGIPIFDKLFKLNPDLYKSIPSWYWAMLLRNNDDSLPVIDQSLAADLQQTQWGREVVAGLAAKLGVSLPARPAQASDGSEEKSDESSATDRASQQVGTSSRFFAPVQATENPPSTTASMPHKNQPR